MTRWPWLYSILRRCRNSFLNSCLRELCYLAAIHEFKIRAVHVPGVSNCYTDILSRWDSNNLVGRTEFLARQFTSCTCPWWYVSIWQWFLTQRFIVLGYPELRRLRRDLKHSQRSAYSCGTYSNLRTQFNVFFFFCFCFKLTPVPAELTTVCLNVQFLSRTLTPLLFVII